MGLPVTVRAYDSVTSEKYGAQVRLTVWCADSKQTWKLMRKLGRELHAVLDGLMVFADSASHYETRIGSGGGCGGWKTGSQAELRIFSGVKE